MIPSAIFQRCSLCTNGVRLVVSFAQNCRKVVCHPVAHEQLDPCQELRLRGREIADLRASLAEKDDLVRVLTEEITQKHGELEEVSRRLEVMETASAFQNARRLTEDDKESCAVLAEALADGSSEAQEALEELDRVCAIQCCRDLQQIFLSSEVPSGSRETKSTGDSHAARYELQSQESSPYEDGTGDDKSKHGGDPGDVEAAAETRRVLVGTLSENAALLVELKRLRDQVDELQAEKAQDQRGQNHLAVGERTLPSTVGPMQDVVLSSAPSAALATSGDGAGRGARDDAHRVRPSDGPTHSGTNFPREGGHFQDHKRPLALASGDGGGDAARPLSTEGHEDGGPPTSYTCDQDWGKQLSCDARALSAIGGGRVAFVETQSATPDTQAFGHGEDDPEAARAHRLMADYQWGNDGPEFDDEEAKLQTGGKKKQDQFRHANADRDRVGGEDERGDDSLEQGRRRDRDRDEEVVVGQECECRRDAGRGLDGDEAERESEGRGDEHDEHEDEDKAEEKENDKGHRAGSQAGEECCEAVSDYYSHQQDADRTGERKARSRNAADGTYARHDSEKATGKASRNLQKRPPASDERDHEQLRADQKDTGDLLHLTRAELNCYGPHRCRPSHPSLDASVSLPGSSTNSQRNSVSKEGEHAYIGGGRDDRELGSGDSIQRNPALFVGEENRSSVADEGAPHGSNEASWSTDRLASYTSVFDLASGDRVARDSSEERNKEALHGSEVTQSLRTSEGGRRGGYNAAVEWSATLEATNSTQSPSKVECQREPRRWTRGLTNTSNGAAAFRPPALTMPEEDHEDIELLLVASGRGIRHRVKGSNEWHRRTRSEATEAQDRARRKLLTEGGFFLVHGKLTASRVRFVWLSQDLGTIFWRRAGHSKALGSVETSCFDSVRRGCERVSRKKCASFARRGEGGSNKVVFTSAGRARRLVLEADVGKLEPEAELLQRNTWYEAFRYAVDLANVAVITRMLRSSAPSTSASSSKFSTTTRRKSASNDGSMAFSTTAPLAAGKAGSTLSGTGLPPQEGPRRQVANTEPRALSKLLSRSKPFRNLPQMPQEERSEGSDGSDAASDGRAENEMEGTSAPFVRPPAINTGDLVGFEGLSSPPARGGKPPDPPREVTGISASRADTADALGTTSIPHDDDSNEAEPKRLAKTLAAEAAEVVKNGWLTPTLLSPRARGGISTVSPPNTGGGGYDSKRGVMLPIRQPLPGSTMPDVDSLATVQRPARQASAGGKSIGVPWGATSRMPRARGKALTRGGRGTRARTVGSGPRADVSGVLRGRSSESTGVDQSRWPAAAKGTAAASANPKRLADCTSLSPPSRGHTQEKKTSTTDTDGGDEVTTRGIVRDISRSSGFHRASEDLVSRQDGAERSSSPSRALIRATARRWSALGAKGIRGSRAKCNDHIDASDGTCKTGIGEIGQQSAPPSAKGDDPLPPPPSGWDLRQRSMAIPSEERVDPGRGGRTSLTPSGVPTAATSDARRRSIQEFGARVAGRADGVKGFATSLGLAGLSSPRARDVKAAASLPARGEAHALSEPYSPGDVIGSPQARGSVSMV